MKWFIFFIGWCYIFFVKICHLIPFPISLFFIFTEFYSFNWCLVVFLLLLICTEISKCRWKGGMSRQHTLRMGSLHAIHTKGWLLHEKHVSNSFLSKICLCFTLLPTKVTQFLQVNYNFILFGFYFRCECLAPLACIRTDDDLSTSAYVYRCRDPQIGDTTNSSWRLLFSNNNIS